MFKSLNILLTNNYIMMMLHISRIHIAYISILFIESSGLSQWVTCILARIRGIIALVCSSSGRGKGFKSLWKIFYLIF